MACVRATFVPSPWFPAKRRCFRVRWLCSATSSGKRGIWDLRDDDRDRRYGRELQEPSRKQLPRRVSPRQWEHSPSAKDPRLDDVRRAKFSDRRNERRPSAPARSDTDSKRWQSRMPRRDRDFHRIRPDGERDRFNNNNNRTESRDVNTRRSDEGLSDMVSRVEDTTTVDHAVYHHRKQEKLDKQPTLLQRALASGNDLLYGVAPVLAALEHGRREFYALFVQDRSTGRSSTGTSTASGNSGRKLANMQADKEIQQLAKAMDIPIIPANKGELNVLSGDRPHQGYVLQSSALEYEELSRLEVPREFRREDQDDSGSIINSDGDSTVADRSKLQPPVWLVLDEVSDPQNFGALLRSAFFLGAAGVIACRRNSSALTPVVSKASAGALEWMNVKGIASMPRFLRSSRERGWHIVGASVGKLAISVQEHGQEPRRPTLLVLGSEGRGLRPLVEAECDKLVRINTAVGDTGGEAPGTSILDSLNVSVAGAIMLYELLKRQ